MNLESEVNAGWLLGIAVLSIALAFSYYFVRVKKGDQTKGQLTLLAALRALGLFGIGFLLLGWLMEDVDEEEESPIVIVATDRSASMLLRQDSSTFSAEVENALDQLEEGLSLDNRLVFVNFSDELGQGRGEGFQGSATDYSQLIYDVSRRYSGQHLGALVVFSDGAVNKGLAPGLLAKQLSHVPIFSLATGDTSEFNDIRLTKVLNNEIGFLNNKIPLQVHVERMGSCDNGRLEVKHAGKVVHSQEVTFPPGENFQAIDLTVLADKLGLQRYDIVISSDCEDKLAGRNNSLEAYLDIVDSRQKVMIVAKAPHPDVFALRTALEGVQGYEVEVVMEKDMGKKDLEGMDLLVLHQVPSGRGSADILSGLNKPMMFVVGAGTDANSFNSFPTGVTLPGSASTDASGAWLNPQFNLFQIDGETMELLNNVPPLVVRYGAKFAGGVAVLNQRVGPVQKSEPLVQVKLDSEPKTVTMMGDGLWRWRLHDMLRNGDHTRFDGFINKLAQLVVLRSDKRRFRVQAPRRVGEKARLQMSGEIYNRSYELQTDGQVKVEFTGPDGKRFSLDMIPNEKGFMLDAGRLPGGLYRWKAEAKWQDERFTLDGEFLVESTQLEWQDPVANHAGLYDMAQLSGGEVLPLERSGEMTDRILAHRNVRKVVHERSAIHPLLDEWWLALLVMGVFAVEWFLRKWFGLA